MSCAPPVEKVDDILRGAGLTSKAEVPIFIDRGAPFSACPARMSRLRASFDWSAARNPSAPTKLSQKRVSKQAVEALERVLWFEQPGFDADPLRVLESCDRNPRILRMRL
jgi:hypothetical protein